MNVERTLEIILFEEMRKILDENIINQLKGGEPNSDIIPMEKTIDNIYFGYLSITRYEHNKLAEEWEKNNATLCITPNMLSKEEFINKLLTDDEFYTKWGSDCCEEIPFHVRVNLWRKANAIDIMETEELLNNSGIPKRKLKN